VHLDRDFDELPKYFEAKRVPTHYFVTKDEKVIHTFPGYWNSEDFKVFLGDIEKKKLKLQK
jgi:thioredoxin-related protein